MNQSLPGVSPQSPEYHKMQRAQQELFIKANLDYENRLRGHMYQFDDAGGMIVNQAGQTIGQRTSSANNTPMVDVRQKD